jgi:hypothetical protein
MRYECLTGSSYWWRIFSISVDEEESVKVISAHLKGYVMYLWLCCALRAAAIDLAASCRLSDTTYSAHPGCGAVVDRSAAPKN